MTKFETDFEIPLDVKHDVVYCQRALANHVLVHQKLSTAVAELIIPNYRAQKSLNQLEREIMAIGSDQKVILNRLRMLVDYYLVKNNLNAVERQNLTNFIGNQIAIYAKMCASDARPMNVQRRLSSDDLNARYVQELNKSRTNKHLTVLDDQTGKIINLVNDDVDAENEIVGEVMEVLISPDDYNIQNTSQKVPLQSYHAQQQSAATNQRKQESLLKPKSERITPKDEKDEVKITVNGNKQHESPPQQQAISLSRLKLKEALCKAKGKKGGQLTPSEICVKAKSESPETVTCVSRPPKAITILSSSQSSNSSSTCGSEDQYDLTDLSKEDQEPAQLGKEPFLRLFGLYTHTYCQYLRKRRTERRRRNCTSTERGDFHYGRLDLFERQYKNRGKREFLYSPPATRAKRQRRVNGDTAKSTATTINDDTKTSITLGRAKGAKLSAASSIASINNSEKVCLVCYKGGHLFVCRNCDGTYHLSCHIVPLVDQTSKEKICPQCWRQKILDGTGMQRKRKQAQAAAK